MGKGSMFNKPFNEINLEDIRLLQQHQVPEGKMIDFKREIHLVSQENRKEFAIDVTSLANTIGGYLIFGVSEEEGIISNINGFNFGNQDNLILQIESILRDLVEPRMAGVQTKFIPVDQVNSVLVIHVLRSFVGPHVVRNKEFYGRNTAGRYKLDFNEIKRRFLENEGLNKEAYDFHINRILKIKSDEAYLRLVPGPSILLHIIPLSSLGLDASLVNLGSPEDGRFPLLYGGGAYHHVGFDGIGVYSSMKGGCIGYHHLNRQGIIEIVDRYYLRILDRNEGIRINIPRIEAGLNEISKQINTNYERFEISGPYILRFALLDVSGATFYNENGWTTEHNILQNDLLFPEVLLNDLAKFERFSNQVIDRL